jgi:hypothetical protein
MAFIEKGIWEVDVIITRRKKFKFKDIKARDLRHAREKAEARAWDESEFGFDKVTEGSVAVKAERIATIGRDGEVKL